MRGVAAVHYGGVPRCFVGFAIADTAYSSRLTAGVPGAAARQSTSSGELQRAMSTVCLTERCVMATTG